jgi:hypothetical protein
MMTLRRNHFITICVAGIFGVLGTITCGVLKVQSEPLKSCADLIQIALQDDTPASQAAIQNLRDLGPMAMKSLMTNIDLRQAPRWSMVLDAVAQQRDAQFSGLYWYTDLDQALAVAKREQKPVLSLRLLGKLTDELSCANSRYFRTTLYPNENVRKVLSDRFVLHWQSVRPVPLITIDFGDGRQIKRTITGNSLHLVLDHQGRIIDVLPGLYGAPEFSRELRTIDPVARRLAELDGSEFQKSRAEFHQDRIKGLTERWSLDLFKARLSETTAIGVDQTPATWTRLAGLYAAESTPNGDAQAAVVSKAPPPAEDANLRLMTKTRAETPMLRVIRNIGHSISEDQVRNQYHLHFRIHTWFAAEQPVPERDQIVARVYSELFLSPLNDPWYGLSRPDAYSAISNDGRVHAVTQNAGH